MDWWVDFVYFTNLPFSVVYLYNVNVIQHSFYVDSNIDQVPVFGLWCTHFRESAPLIQYWHQLYYQVQSEAFFALIDSTNHWSPF